ncbi:MAG: phosphatase PAP2 family protein [Ignavibacteriae bacterium]|nr:phosphatase PAP2 family protein [Ignavibacteriota bacterium]
MFYKSYKIFFILFLLFTSSLNAQRRDLLPKKPDPNNIDVKVFRAINNSRCKFLNTVIPISSNSIYFTSTLIPATLFGVSRANNNYYDENSSVLLALSEGLSAGIVFGMKNIYKRERPYKSLSNVHYNASNLPSDRYSFPSGHTSMSFSMATSLTLRYPDKPLLITGLYLYSTVVSLGRIYLGVHYPSDVLAGMLIGSGSAVIVYSLRKEIIEGKNNLFKEKGREDVNQKSVEAPLILLSLIGTDVVNYFIGSTHSKILNYTKFNFDLNGNENKLLLKVDF